MSVRVQTDTNGKVRYFTVSQPEHLLKLSNYHWKLLLRLLIGKRLLCLDSSQ